MSSQLDTRVDVDWVRATLDRGWGAEWSRRPLSPRTDWLGRPTGDSWLVHASGRPHVFTIRLDPAERAPAALFPVRQKVLAHCRRQGVPAPDPVPTTDGGTVTWRGDLACELTPALKGAVPHHFGPDQIAAVVRSGLLLRASLDQVPEPVVSALAAVPAPPPPCWRAAVEAARTELLPLAGRRTDDWSQACAAMLRGVLAAEPLMDALRPRTARAVVHGSLCGKQFVLSGGRDPQVLGLLDFGALHVGDPLLDLAALADTAARVRAGETAQRRALASFQDLAARGYLLADGQEQLLMPLLLTRTVPPLVELVRAVLLAGRRGPGLIERFDRYDPMHKAHVHRLLTGPAW
ncbi:phosphotransferase [Crossiella sp. SN42]|uniref:phosphotransferase n=1 Tax=Crossiella sp. SN42 TaxID=2944808 RepID=UPI00207C37AD|nr:phosphotransferase [Crossiella sp. SN42]MCO1580048.1 phosphotransferase [Crossiella sp. SN42]